MQDRGNGGAKLRVFTERRARDNVVADWMLRNSVYRFPFAVSYCTMRTLEHSRRDSETQNLATY